jgi:hypothetical protein
MKDIGGLISKRSSFNEVVKMEPVHEDEKIEVEKPQSNPQKGYETISFYKRAFFAARSLKVHMALIMAVIIFAGAMLFVLTEYSNIYKVGHYITSIRFGLIELNEYPRLVEIGSKEFDDILEEIVTDRKEILETLYKLVNEVESSRDIFFAEFTQKSLTYFNQNLTDAIFKDKVFAQSVFFDKFTPQNFNGTTIYVKCQSRSRITLAPLKRKWGM